MTTIHFGKLVTHAAYLKIDFLSQSNFHDFRCELKSFCFQIFQGLLLKRFWVEQPKGFSGQKLSVGDIIMILLIFQFSMKRKFSSIFFVC